MHHYPILSCKRPSIRSYFTQHRLRLLSIPPPPALASIVFPPTYPPSLPRLRFQTCNPLAGWLARSPIDSLPTHHLPSPLPHTCVSSAMYNNNNYYDNIDGGQSRSILSLSAPVVRPSTDSQCIKTEGEKGEGERQPKRKKRKE